MWHASTRIHLVLKVGSRKTYGVQSIPKIQEIEVIRLITERRDADVRFAPALKQGRLAPMHFL